MKKIIVSVLIVLIFVTLAGNNNKANAKSKNDDAEKNEISKEEGIALSRNSKTIYVDKSFSLKLKGLSSDKLKVKWSSSDENIAKVENGKVTGVGEGVAYITAEYKGNSYSCKVKVKAPGLSFTKKRVRINNSFTLTVNGTEAVSYTTSKKKIASVTDDGVVTALKEGVAEISCLCENGETYTCEVEVYLNILDIENPEFSDLAPTVNMSFEELVGDNGIYDELVMMPAPGTYRLIVDLYHKVVMAYTKDEKGEYTKPVRYMLCGVGASSTPTPTGTFKMENYRLRYELFNKTICYGQYWSILTGRIYFHSILYTSFNAKDYTETSYDNLGKSVSHGCIRLTVPDARWIYYNVAPGTEVEVRKGSSSDTETAAIRKKLVLAKRPSKRPDLKMGEIPDTDNWTIDEVPQEVEFIQGSQNGGEAAY